MSIWKIEESTKNRYLESCLDSCNNESIFLNFKRDHRYSSILEHVGNEEGLLYLEELGESINFFRRDIEKIKKNDLYGNPITFNYESIGEVSPTTIRYAKSSYDILKFFGDIKYENVVEIGGGYGGFCLVFNQIVGFSKYRLYDLPEVNMLSSKYLSKFPEMDDKVLFSVIDDAPGDSYDLLVSNYALSELSLEIQREYIEKVLKRCKRFYLIFNQIGDLNLDDLIQSLPEYDIHVEIEHPSLPYKDKLNRILYGNKRNTH